MQIQSIFIGIIFSTIMINSIVADDISTEENSDFSISCYNGFKTGEWKDCANSLSSIIWNRYAWCDNQPIHICKFKCIYKFKGHISHFRWVWDAKFGCGEETPEFIGEARRFKSKQNAMKHAIAQAIEQAITYGKYTPDDFKCD